MRKRLLYIVLAATLAASLTTALALPASADQATVSVTLTDGTTVPVQVDVPPGTPVSQIQIPTVSVPGPGTPSVPTPTVPGTPSVPTPTVPGTGGGGIGGGGGGGAGGGGGGGARPPPTPPPPPR